MPHGNRRPSSPRAAFSHSASVGNRLPAHAQYAAASCQLTCVTGCWFIPEMLEFNPCGWRQSALSLLMNFRKLRSCTYEYETVVSAVVR